MNIPPTKSVKRPNFRTVHVLVADPDICLAQAIISNLRVMGFVNITHVKSGNDALRVLRSQQVNFLITEWDLRGSNGIELVRYLRRGKDSPNRTLPVIMLTGHGEEPDVVAARDVGITEFVVKPFSADTLFSRIEEIVDNPREFVVAPNFVGPERRRRGEPPPGVEDRRRRDPLPAVSAREAFVNESSGPQIISADQSLRHAMGTAKPLSAIISPEILAEAQRAIDAMSESSLQWIREDVAKLQTSFAALRRHYSTTARLGIKEAALSIKARAGTFGYDLASSVARLLYVFMSVDFIPTNDKHLVIIEKHIQTLVVIFGKGMKGATAVGDELYFELQRLIDVKR